MAKKVLKTIFKVIFVPLLFVAVITVWSSWYNRMFEEKFYTIYSQKAEEPVRLILLTDLHQWRFGSHNEALTSRIEELRPDLILLGGDIINRKHTELSYVEELCRQLVEIAPVYYGLGNHENEVVYGMDLGKKSLEKSAGLLGDNIEDLTPLIKDSALLDKMEALGVHVVQNTCETAEIKGTAFSIAGISTNLSSFWPYSGEFIYQWVTEDEAPFKILISHRPEPAEEYLSDYPIDLIVSGHNHGGVVRIPGKGGLFSADDGFFPELDEGMIEMEAAALIISRGLGNHGIIPRINNRPELVIIDIN